MKYFQMENRSLPPKDFKNSAYKILLKLKEIGTCVVVLCKPIPDTLEDLH